MIAIRPDDLCGKEIISLLEAHLREMHATTPAGSVHALDLAGLRAPDVNFWCAWEDLRLAGCGALRRIDDEHVEIKSMRTAPAFQRQGVATRMLRHLLAEAKAMKARRVSLETGSMPYFEPARMLYEKHGFKECGPFATYQADPNSVFMTRQLSS